MDFSFTDEQAMLRDSVARDFGDTTVPAAPGRGPLGGGLAYRLLARPGRRPWYPGRAVRRSLGWSGWRSDRDHDRHGRDRQGTGRGPYLETVVIGGGLLDARYPACQRTDRRDHCRRGAAGLRVSRAGEPLRSRGCDDVRRPGRRRVADQRVKDACAALRSRRICSSMRGSAAQMATRRGLGVPRPTGRRACRHANTRRSTAHALRT